MWWGWLTSLICLPCRFSFTVCSLRCWGILRKPHESRNHMKRLKIWLRKLGGSTPVNFIVCSSEGTSSKGPCVSRRTFKSFWVSSRRKRISKPNHGKIFKEIKSSMTEKLCKGIGVALVNHFAILPLQGMYMRPSPALLPLCTSVESCNIFLKAFSTKIPVKCYSI